VKRREKRGKGKDRRGIGGAGGLGGKGTRVKTMQQAKRRRNGTF
jgi:hypothetical protein